MIEHEKMTYSLQLSMLSLLYSRHMLSDTEYKRIKIRLMKKSCGNASMQRKMEKSIALIAKELKKKPS